MASYRLSTLAEADVAEMYTRGIEHFGLTAARQYLLDLEHTMQLLAKSPSLGGQAFDLYPGLRRMVYGAHVVFYLPTDHGILVARVLDQRMDVDLYF